MSESNFEVAVMCCVGMAMWQYVEDVRQYVPPKRAACGWYGELRAVDSEDEQNCSANKL